MIAIKLINLINNSIDGILSRVHLYNDTNVIIMRDMNSVHCVCSVAVMRRSCEYEYTWTWSKINTLYSVEYI